MVLWLVKGQNSGKSRPKKIANWNWTHSKSSPIPNMTFRGLSPWLDNDGRMWAEHKWTRALIRGMLFFETGGGGGFVFKLWEQLPHTAGKRNVYLITFCLFSLRLSHVNSHLTEREKERERLRVAEREGKALHQCAGKEECGFTAVRCLKLMWKDRERGSSAVHTISFI